MELPMAGAGVSDTKSIGPVNDILIGWSIKHAPLQAFTVPAFDTYPLGRMPLHGKYCLPLARGKDLRFRQRFAILLCPQDERLDEIPSLLDGLFIGLTMREVAGKLGNGHHVGVILIRPLDDHRLTLSPDKSGRFSGHHGNQRYRSRQGPARPETDGDSSVGRRCSTGSSSSGAHCVPIRECLYPRERCIAEPANPIWLAQGNRSTSRGAHWFCDHQGPFSPRMNPGAFWPVYGKRAARRNSR